MTNYGYFAGAELVLGMVGGTGGGTKNVFSRFSRVCRTILIIQMLHSNAPNTNAPMNIIGQSRGERFCGSSMPQINTPCITQEDEAGASAHEHLEKQYHLLKGSNS